MVDSIVDEHHIEIDSETLKRVKVNLLTFSVNYIVLLVHSLFPSEYYHAKLGTFQNYLQHKAGV